MVPLNYLSNFWRTLEMPLINCEVNQILTWSATCVTTKTFEIRDTKLYFPVVTQDSSNLPQQLKPGFERPASWNIYLSKPVLLR